ncbi:MAG: hypothetical protein ACI8UG_001154 [Gammaproteobacteria bacterium]
MLRLSEGEVGAMDGKYLRSSYNRHDRQSIIHIVSVFVTANAVLTAQRTLPVYYTPG